ncbi:hypothetical protein SAMN05216499_13056 [Actinacidiphila paucisporea]|uniref:Uncharacterized protein n=1 Tax=Actinacidiphila paucisporea TaxID=310782 RepID=A0A1M7Q8S5_9ACTN|nr:hypothetical protein SAMN05216499_13056 [Actinacidiphila paucisporea]
MTVHDIDRNTCGQQDFDGRRHLRLSSEMQRSPALSIGSPRVGAISQQRPQAVHVTVASRVVHRGPPQPIPIRHADHPHPA